MRRIKHLFQCLQIGFEFANGIEIEIEQSALIDVLDVEENKNQQGPGATHLMA